MKFLQTLYGKFLPMVMMFLSLSGCINEDYQNCPVPGGLFLAPTFTMHTVKNTSGSYRDLFGETAQEQAVYVFDQSGLFLRKITENGPFTNGHLTRLDLPEGSYRAVIWVNATEDFVLNRVPVKGETSIDDLLLQLQELNSQTITKHFSPLLYGTTNYFTVEKSMSRTADKVIPVSLIRDTHKIQVIIRWRDKKTGTLCEKPYHANETYAYILDKNGVLDFENNAGQSPWLTYIPKYFSGDALKPFLDSNSKAAIVAAEFTVLRLWLNSETKVSIRKAMGTQGEVNVYETDLMPLIKKTKAYEDQESIDREEYFKIELEFECDDNDDPDDDTAWVAGSIMINGWVVSKMDDEDTDL